MKQYANVVTAYLIMILLIILVGIFQSWGIALSILIAPIGYINIQGMLYPPSTMPISLYFILISTSLVLAKVRFAILFVQEIKNKKRNSDLKFTYFSVHFGIFSNFLCHFFGDFGIKSRISIILLNNWFDFIK